MSHLNGIALFQALADGSMNQYIGFILQLDGANITIYDVDNSNLSVGCH
jgi:hypothetical protein